MSYVHTRECDASYELKASSFHTLPPSVRALINPRHRPRVRITTDQKTGRELAKIIKMRVADIEIYSPRTLFDWRVSVSLEMNYEGDTRDLEEAGAEGGKRPDRNKDRMSYKHLAYQIDLTQVTPAEVGAFAACSFLSGLCRLPMWQFVCARSVGVWLVELMVAVIRIGDVQGG